MCGTCRGFTLLEVLVALSILVVGFGVLFDLLASARKEYELSKGLYQDLVFLSNGLLDNRMEGIRVKEASLKDYPGIKEVQFSYGRAVIYIYR